MTNFNPLNFIADHAGVNLADAIKEAYEQGKRDAQPESCRGCKYEPRYSHEEPCGSCSNNYVNKYEGR